MADRLGNQHISALLALLGLGYGGKVSNTELAELAGFKIDGDVRRTLNQKGWVTSERAKGNAPYVHELTKDGLARCAKELSADRPAQARPLSGALYLILRGLDRYLKRENLGLAKVFQPYTEISREDLETHIRKAYAKLAREPRDWVRLAELRPLLNGAARADVDGVLREMSRAKQAHLVPSANLKALTEADHVAAIRIGGDDNHLIVIEGS